jgi:hypothetical protein
MKTYLITKPLVLSLIFGLGTASIALADDDCRVPMADWQPRGAVQQMAETQGWTVRRIKTDDGCYEIKGRDADGREIEVKVDPATLEIVDFEYENDHDEDTLQRDTAAPEGTVNPPANGLLTPGTVPVVEQ